GVVSMLAAWLVARSAFKAQRANFEAEVQRLVAAHHHQEAESLSTGLILDRSQALCEQGDAGAAMLWLARGLAIAIKADSANIQRVMRINLAACRSLLSPLLRPPLEHRGQVIAVAFRPDGDEILTGSSDGITQVWHAATGTRVGPPLHHQGRAL